MLDDPLDDPLDFEISDTDNNHIHIRVPKVEPCGIKDEMARVLEPIHYDCDGCKALIKVRLLGRKILLKALKRREPVQTSLLDNIKRRK